MVGDIVGESVGLTVGDRVGAGLSVSLSADLTIPALLLPQSALITAVPLTGETKVKVVEA